MSEAGERALPSLSAEEWRAGMVRLGLVAGGLVLLSMLLAAGFAAFGAGGRAALSAGTGIVGVVLVFAGVVAFSRTGSIRRRDGMITATTKAERRSAEVLALGLFGFGIAFSACSLVIG